MLDQFEKTGEQALAELQKVADLAALEEFRIKYLGRKGQVTQMLSQIGKFPPEQKPQACQLSKMPKPLYRRSRPNLKSLLMSLCRAYLPELAKRTSLHRP
jgi:phenylalanyl-tRNA synthetase alpha chain